MTNKNATPTPKPNESVNQTSSSDQKTTWDDLKFVSLANETAIDRNPYDGISPDVNASTVDENPNDHTDIGGIAFDGNKADLIEESLNQEDSLTALPSDIIEDERDWGTKLPELPGNVIEDERDWGIASPKHSDNLNAEHSSETSKVTDLDAISYTIDKFTAERDAAGPKETGTIREINTLLSVLEATQKELEQPQNQLDAPTVINNLVKSYTESAEKAQDEGHQGLANNFATSAVTAAQLADHFYELKVEAQKSHDHEPEEVA